MQAAPQNVLGIAEARAELPSLIRRLRDDPTAGPFAIGSHRKPSAYLVSTPSDPADRQAGVRDELHRLAGVIRSLGVAHGIDRVRVFGSVARDEETPTSDVDLLVRLRRGTSTVDVARFALDMEALLGRTVDIATESGLRPGRHDEILRDAAEL